jgi:toxin ParE1/3/4
MAYQVRLTRRALRDLARIYQDIQDIQVEVSTQAVSWFNGLEETIYSLEQHPDRSPTIPKNSNLRHLLYGRKPHVYRIIYEVKKRTSTVSVLHVRHGARDKMPKL